MHFLCSYRNVHMLYFIPAFEGMLKSYGKCISLSEETILFLQLWSKMSIQDNLDGTFRNM